jgi:hypothetical protein
MHARCTASVCQREKKGIAPNREKPRTHTNADIQHNYAFLCAICRRCAHPHPPTTSSYSMQSEYRALQKDTSDSVPLFLSSPTCKVSTTVVRAATTQRWGTGEERSATAAPLLPPPPLLLLLLLMRHVADTSYGCAAVAAHHPPPAKLNKI